MKYKVNFTDRQAEFVEADHFTIEEGALVFYKPLDGKQLGTNDKKRYVAYKNWHSVERR